ncbi:MAG: hypothetical protein QOJ76_849 [Acidobacteriota bacterium]|jgi:hypothetical protein|nr:hypothetical protein [Acidobacteriota bacterium]
MSQQPKAIFTQAVAVIDAVSDDAPRIYGPFAALVRGTNARGERFESETELDDLSAADFNLRLRQPLERGARLFAVVRLCKALVAMHGVVLRAEPKGDGSRRLSVAIIHNRFLS